MFDQCRYTSKLYLKQGSNCIKQSSDDLLDLKNTLMTTMEDGYTYHKGTIIDNDTGDLIIQINNHCH